MVIPVSVYTYLSLHFKLSEFLETQVPGGFDANVQSLYPDNLFRLRDLCRFILEPARCELGFPIRINSGYRCPDVNSRVGGVKNSQHLDGYAADVTCYDNARLLSLLKKLPYDQLICYGKESAPRFIHVSYSDRNRRQYFRKP